MKQAAENVIIRRHGIYFKNYGDIYIFIFRVGILVFELMIYYLFRPTSKQKKNFYIDQFNE